MSLAYARKGQAARRAGWLIVGWIAFWLGAAVYPCQYHHAAPCVTSGPAALAVNAGGHFDSTPLDSSPAPLNGTCQELTGPVLGASDAVAPAGGTPQEVTPPFAAFDAVWPRIAFHAPEPDFGSQPPPHTPLYLSTQRLLI